MKISEFRLLEPEEVNKMSSEELKEIIKTVGKTANKRLDNIRKRDLGVRAEEYSKFSTKGKNHNQLKQEVKRLVTFLDPSKKTYTVRGAESFAKKMSSKLGVNWGVMSKAERTLLMRVFDRVEDIYPGLSKRVSYGSNQIASTINVEINPHYANSIFEISNPEERENAIREYIDEIWGNIGEEITSLYENSRK